MPSLARIWWLRLAPVSTSCRAVRPSKSVAFRRLRRPGLTPQNIPPPDGDSRCAGPMRRFFSCHSARSEAESQNLFGNSDELFLPSLARLARLRLAPVSTSCRAVRPSKSVAFRRLRRPGACILLGFACHPWRGFGGFDWPQSRHPVEPFGPRKALLFVGYADRVRAFCWGLHAIPGADLVASIGPSLDVLSSRSALEKRCFSSATPTGCVHSVGVCMPSLARIWWLRLAPVSTSCRAVRPSKSVAFRRLRRPGLTPQNIPPPDGDSRCAGPMRRFFSRHSARSEAESQNLFGNLVGANWWG